MSSLSALVSLPRGAIEHILTCELDAKDMCAFLQAVRSTIHHAFLRDIVSTVCTRLLRQSVAGRVAIRSKLANESPLDLLRFVHALDPCAAPADADAQVWSCGRNDVGQGARNGDDVNALTRAASPPCTPYAPLCNAPLVAVAAGADFSFALTAAGGVLVAGSNASGQLGLGCGARAIRGWLPCTSLSNIRIVQLVCGGSHTLVLDSYGRIWGSGANDVGQLGLGRHTSVVISAFTPIPNSFPHPSSVRMLAAGRAHSVALLDDGRVFAAGDGRGGQLGRAHARGCAYNFVRLLCFGHRVVRVAAGADTTMLLTANNMILVSGKRPGCLSVIGGLGSARVTHLGVGQGFAIARTHGRDVALSTCRKRFAVTDSLTSVGAHAVSAGLAHYAIVTHEGGVLAAGANAFGQVAAGQMGLTIEGGAGARIIRAHRVPLSNVAIPQGYRALQVAAGAYHSIYLLQRSLHRTHPDAPHHT